MEAKQVIWTRDPCILHDYMIMLIRVGRKAKYVISKHDYV